jgi:four helix bundle protein
VRRKHHELVAWQVAVELVSDIYKLSASFPHTEQYGLTSQLRRAAISVPSNIAEGAARTSKKEFLHFLSVARGSLSEIDTQLTIAKRLGLISDDTQIQESLDRVFGLIGGLIRSLERRGATGSTG